MRKWTEADWYRHTPHRGGARHTATVTHKHAAVWPLGTSVEFGSSERTKFGVKTKAESQTGVCCLGTLITPAINRVAQVTLMKLCPATGTNTSLEVVVAGWWHERECWTKFNKTEGAPPSGGSAHDTHCHGVRTKLLTPFVWNFISHQAQCFKHYVWSMKVTIWQTVTNNTHQ